MLKQVQLIEYACPTCKADFGTYPEKAGTGTNCIYCKTDFMIPVGLHPKEVSVSLAPHHREVSPQEAVVVPNNVPLRMILPNGLGGLDVPVSQKTANSIAQTFLGGLLVAIGVALAAMIGIRKRS